MPRWPGKPAQSVGGAVAGPTLSPEKPAAFGKLQSGNSSRSLCVGHAPHGVLRDSPSAVTTVWPSGTGQLPLVRSWLDGRDRNRASRRSKRARSAAVMALYGVTCQSNCWYEEQPLPLAGRAYAGAKWKQALCFRNPVKDPISCAGPAPRRLRSAREVQPAAQLARESGNRGTHASISPSKRKPFQPAGPPACKLCRPPMPLLAAPRRRSPRGVRRAGRCAALATPATTVPSPAPPSWTRIRSTGSMGTRWLLTLGSTEFRAAWRRLAADAASSEAPQRW